MPFEFTLSSNYDLFIPQVTLLCEDGELATQEVKFVDDVHIAVRTKEDTFDHTRDGCRHVKSRMNSLGSQV